mgnify:CR=1 FL=1
MAIDDRMRYTMSVRLHKGEKAFGPGIALLLKLVEEKHSLRSAAAEMNMAYSKAWRIVKDTETALGFKMLNSTIGGRNGGGAALTDDAIDMLHRYDAFMADVHAAADALFEKHFPTAP